MQLFELGFSLVHDRVQLVPGRLGLVLGWLVLVSGRHGLVPGQLVPHQPGQLHH